MDYLLHCDRQLFYLINSRWINSVFDWLMPIISNPWFWALPIFFIFLLLFTLGKKRGRLTIVLIILTVALADSFSARVIKPSIKRLRPSRALENVRVLGKRGGKYGFPSNHVANFTGGLAILTFFYRRGWYLSLLIVLLVGYSRIYLGVHYPLDVLGGIFIGLGCAMLFLIGWLMLDNHLRKRGDSALSL